MSKLALGTVEFGLDYGIRNTTGHKVPTREVARILTDAAQHGIELLDTAQMYGESEAVLGDYLDSHPDQIFQVVTKYDQNSGLDPVKAFHQSCKQLGLTSLYGYLLHHFSSYQRDPAILDKLHRLKEQGVVEKVGFSLYYPEELDELLSDQAQFDLIQVPYSLLDQRFEEYFSRLSEDGVEVHVRSVFLQGLLFYSPDKLPEQFASLCPTLQRLRELSRQHQVPVYALCINFAALHPKVDKVVIGVNSLGELQENLEFEQYQATCQKILPELTQLTMTDERILVPRNWQT